MRARGRGAARTRLARGFWALAVVVSAALGPRALDGAQSPADGEQLAALTELPRPHLEAEEPEARQRMETARASLDALLASPGATALQLGQAFARLGRLYFAYRLDEVAPIALANAVALQPDNWQWLHLLAVHRQQVGLMSEAESLFLQVVELAPDYAPARVRLGDLALERGDLELAAQQYRRAMELSPESASAWAGLGRLAAQRGDHREAARRLERALELQPSANALHHPLGMAYRALGERDRARSALARNEHGRLVIDDPLILALETENLSNQVLRRQARAAVESGDVAAGIDLFRRYLELEPDDPIVHHDLGQALLLEGRVDEGLAELRRAVEIDPSNRRHHVQLGAALVDLGRPAEAVEAYRRAHEIDPEDAVTHIDYALLLAKTNRADQGIAELRSILAEDPGEQRARLQLGVVLASEQRYGEALVELEAVAESAALGAQDRGRAQYHLGLIEQSRGNVGDARRRFTRAVELDPGSTDARLWLAQGLGAEGRYSEAAEQYERILALDPGVERAHFGRALALMLAERYADAAAGLEQSLEQRPDDLPLLNAQARLLAACPDDAVRDGERAPGPGPEPARAQLDPGARRHGGDGAG